MRTCVAGIVEVGRSAGRSGARLEPSAAQLRSTPVHSCSGIPRRRRRTQWRDVQSDSTAIAVLMQLASTDDAEEEEEKGRAVG